MNRRTKIILVSATAAIILGAAVFVFLRSKDEQQPEPAPAAEVIRPEEFSSGPVVAPILSFSGNTAWFFDTTGRLFSKPALEEGAQTQFSLPPLPGFIDVVWQKEGGSFIVQQNVEGHTNYQLYDSNTGSFVQYPQQLRRPLFLSGGNRIVYDWVTDGTRHELKVSDLSSENFRTVAELFRPDYLIEPSPAADEAVLFASDYNNPNQVFLVDLDSGNFTEVAERGAYEGAKFSPDGTKLLLARWESERAALPNLILYDLNTLFSTALGISASIEQASWVGSSRILIGSTAGIIDYDVSTQAQKLVYRFPAISTLFEPTFLLLHPNGKALLFADKKTGLMYRIELE
jgi:hypothetical protein